MADGARHFYDPPDPARMRQRTILVVEPDDMVQEHYRSALKPLGCSFIQTASASAAMAVCRQIPPDLVITELMLPDASGVDVLHAFDSDPVLKTVPIVAVSSAAARDQLAPADAVEFADCLLKPVDGLRLRATIQRLLA